MLKSPEVRHYYLTLLLFFLIPVFQKLVAIVLILVVLNWLSKGKSAFQFKGLRTNYSLHFLMAFYLWHVVGLAWSSDMDFALFDLQVKLPFILLPLIYVNFGRFKARFFENILSSYVIGCLGAILIGIVNSIYAYVVGENPFLDFYNANISPVLHIGYFAMYLNMGLVIVIYKIIKNEENFYTWKNAFLIIASFVLALATFLSTSRNGFIGLIFLLLIIFTYAIVRYRKWLLGISAVLMVWIVASSFLKDIATGKMSLHGLDQVEQVMQSESISKSEGESTGVRLLVWKSALELIQENPLLGTGTGDIKNDLMATYKKNGYIKPYERNYNAHNQFLQSFAALGILGLVLLLFVFGYPLVISFVRYNYLYFMFSLNIGVSCLTESILEVQAGVIFMALFAVLFSPITTSSVNRRFKFLKSQNPTQ